MKDSTQKIVYSAASALGVYVLFFGIPFQGTISTYIQNRQILKQQKMRYAHEEAMARLNKEKEE